MRTPRLFSHAFSEDSRRRSLSASLVFSISAILASLGAIGWGLYAFFETMSLLQIVGGPVAGAIPYIMFAGGIINLIVSARSVRIAVVARRVGSGRIAKSVFRIAFNIAGLILPALIIDTVCGLVLLFSAALAELISQSSLFAASFNYYGSTHAQDDLDYVQSNLLCCGAQSPSDWAAPINRSPHGDQSPTVVPKSCCPPHASMEECHYSKTLAPASFSGSVAHSYHDGCIKHAVSFLYFQHFVSSGLAFGIALLMLLVAVCQRLAQTSARAALESGDSGGPAPAWLFRDPRRQRDTGPPYSLWTDESPGWPKQRDQNPTVKPADRPAHGNPLREIEAPKGVDEPAPPPSRPPPPRPQIKIKHIRPPESSGNSGRDDVYEVYSTSGPPAYYGADGLLLNQSRVQALQSSASEHPEENEDAEKQPETIQPAKKSEEVAESREKKRAKFSFAKTVRKVVSKTKAAGRRKLTEKRSNRSCHTSDSDVELMEGFRKGRKDANLLLRPARSDQRAVDETNLLTPDKDNMQTPRRSRQATRLPGIHRQRITDAENDILMNKLSAHRSRLQEERSGDRECQCDSKPIYPPGSIYYTSSDMPTETSVTPVPSSDENFVMGLRRSPTPSKSSTSSQWSSKESSPERRRQDKASQTTFVEDEDTVIEKSQESASMSTSQTLMPETVLKTTSFYGVLTEKKGEKCAKLEQMTKVRSLSYIITDERMPIESPRRSLSQKLPTIESAPSDNATVSQVASLTNSFEFTGGQTICISMNAESPELSVIGTAEHADMLPTEPKRRRISSLEEIRHSFGTHDKVDCGVPNESSADVGLISEDTEGTWRPLSEEYFDSLHDATRGNMGTLGEPEIEINTAEVPTKTNIVPFINIECVVPVNETLERLRTSSLVAKSGERKEEREGSFQETKAVVGPENDDVDLWVQKNDDDSKVPLLKYVVGPVAAALSSSRDVASCYRAVIEKREITPAEEVRSTHGINLEDMIGASGQYVEKTAHYQHESQQPAGQSPASDGACSSATTQRTAGDDVGRCKIENTSVSGVSDNIPSWLVIDSKLRDNESQNLHESKPPQMGNTIKDGLIQSSKHLAIAVPDKKSIQLLYQGQAKQRDSSEMMLENRYDVFESQPHRENKEDLILNEGNISTLSSESDMSMNKEEISTSIVNKNETGRGSLENVNQTDSCVRSVKSEVSTKTAGSLQGKQSIIFQISAQYSTKSETSVKTSKKQLSRKKRDDRPDNTPSIYVACSRERFGSVNQISDNNREEDESGEHQPGIIIEFDRSINSFSVASGVASLGFLCLKEYNQNKGGNQEKNTSKGTSRHSITTPTKSKQWDSRMSSTTRKKVVFPIPGWKRHRKIALQKFACSQDHEISIAHNLKDADGVPNAMLCPREAISGGDLNQRVSRDETIELIGNSENHQQSTSGGTESAGPPGNSEINETSTAELADRSDRMNETGVTESQDVARLFETHKINETGTYDSAERSHWINETGVAESEDEGNQRPMSRAENTVSVSQPSSNHSKNLEESLELRNDAVDKKIETPKSEVILRSLQGSTGGTTAGNQQVTSRNGTTESTEGLRNQQRVDMDIATAMLIVAHDKQTTDRGVTTGSEETAGKQQMKKRDTMTESERCAGNEEETDTEKIKTATISVEHTKVSSVESMDVTIERVTENKAFEKSNNTENCQCIGKTGLTNQQTVNRDGITESKEFPDNKQQVIRDETTTSAGILSSQQTVDKDRETGLSKESVDDQPVSSSTTAERVFLENQRETDLPESANKQQTLNKDGSSASELTGTIQKKNQTIVEKKIGSIPCLGLTDWTSTDISQESAEFPVPSEISVSENIGTRHTSDSVCCTSALNQNTPKGRIISDKSTKDSESAAKSNDYGTLEIPSATSNEARPALLVDKTSSSGQPSSLNSVCFCTDEEQYNQTDLSKESDTAANEDESSSSAVENPLVKSNDNRTLDNGSNNPQKPLDNAGTSEPRGGNEVSHRTDTESSIKSHQPGMNTSWMKGNSERDEHVYNSSGPSGMSIQTQYFPSTFNLTGAPQKTRAEHAQRPESTPRTLHKHRIENLFDYCNTSTGGRPPSAGDYTPYYELTERPMNWHEFDSGMGESQISLLQSVLPNLQRIHKAYELENRVGPVPGSDDYTGTSEVLPNEITVPLLPLLELLSAKQDLDPSRLDPHTLMRLLDTRMNQSSSTDEEKSHKATPTYQGPVKLKKIDPFQTNIETGDCSKGLENYILDRRKVETGLLKDEDCGNCGDVIGRGSTYRINQQSVTQDMGISLSHFTTNVRQRDQRTHSCELSSKSSSSYNCRNCDCSANKQTSVEDSSGVENRDKASRKKTRKQRDGSESQSSCQSNSSHFVSATSDSADFLGTSDFESGEATSTASNVTGRIRSGPRRDSPNSYEEYDYDADIEDSVNNI